MNLPNHQEILRLFTSFLVESGLSAVSIKNYLSDIRHFLRFLESHKYLDLVEVFQNDSKYINEYNQEQKSVFTPPATTNRRLASLRRLATFLNIKFQVIKTPKIEENDQLNQNVSDTSLASKDISSKKILDQFKQHLINEKKTHSTVKNYLSDLYHYFSWIAKDTPYKTEHLAQILSTDQLNGYISYLKLTHTGSSVISRRQSSIKKLTHFCYGRELIPSDPFEVVVTQAKLSPFSWLTRLIPKAKTAQNAPKSRLAIAYHKYNALPFTPYLHLALLVIATTTMGILAYNQVITQAKPSSAATALTPPKRQLSFQGRLSDSVGTPITTPVSVEFKLWNNLTVGSQLYTTNTCSVTPDDDGIFNSLIGDTVCGAEIPQSVFTDNRDVFLEVKVGSETLTPRQQIATVGYALNSETLQGYPASATATINTVPVIDNSGNMVIAASSPTIESTSGNFNIKGQSLSLTTALNSGGDIVLQPDALGSGQILAIGGTTTEDSFRITNANLTTGSLISGYVGNDTATGSGNLLMLSSGATESAKFWVTADGRTNIATATDSAITSAFTVNQNGTGNIFSASSSGITRFLLNNLGAITTIDGVGHIIDDVAGDLSLNSAGGDVLLGASDNLQITAAGNLIFGGNTSLAETTSNTDSGAYLIGAFDEFTNSNSTNVQAILKDFDTSIGSIATSDEWDTNLGSIFTKNSSLDFFLGGQATSSAKFAVLNMNSGTPTASIAGTVANQALFIDGNGNISTTNRQNLVLGNSATYNSTGNILLNPNGTGRVGIGTTAPGAELEVKGSGTGRALIGQWIDPSYSFISLNGLTGTSANLYSGATDSNLYINRPTGADILFSLNNTNQMIIKNSGNVGIGTTAPGANLVVNGGVSGNDIFRIIRESNANNSFAFSAPGNDALLVMKELNAGTAWAMGIDTTNADSFTLSQSTAFGTNDYLTVVGQGGSSGYIGIGTTLPTAKLDVAGFSGGTYGLKLNGAYNQIQISDSDNAKLWSVTTVNDANLDFREDGLAATSRLYLQSGGNVGIGTTSPVGKLDVTDVSNTASSFSLTNNTATTLSSVANLTANALTTGKLLNLSSTSIGLTTGGLASLDWSPGSSTTATGDLFSLNIGANGTIGNLFNIKDSGSSIFSVSETALTSNLPTSFTSPGDVSMSYDLVFTNPTSSSIKSAAPLYIQAGETFNSSDLNLQTYNKGNVVVTSEAFTTSGAATISGTLTAGSTTTFGGQTYTWPASQTPNYVLQTNGAGTLSWVAQTGGGSSYWDQQNGSLYAMNNTVDLLLGGQSTASAKFKVLNMNTGSGTPTASISGATNIATFIDGNGNISTTNRQNLVLGNSATYSSTGNILLNPNGTGNVGIGTTNPGAILDVRSTNPQVMIGGNQGTNVRVNSVTGSIFFPATSANTYGSKIESYVGPYSDDVSLLFYTASSTTPAERMRIDRNGNVGIGTTLPTAKLDVAGAIMFGTSSNRPTMQELGSETLIPTGASVFGASYGSGLNGNLFLDLKNNNSGDSILFRYSAANNTVVDTIGLMMNGIGRVGIGTTNPSALLDINGDVHISTLAIGATDTVITHSSGTLQQRTIDSRVWGSSLIDGSGTANFVARWSDINTLTIGSLYDDGTNVGIGTTAPTQKLDVAGVFVVDSVNGRVGIGTTSPTSTLDIGGAFSTISNTIGDITFNAASGFIDFSGNSLKNFLNATASGQIKLGNFSTAGLPSTIGIGSILYNTTSQKPMYHDGVNWINIQSTSVPESGSYGFWQRTNYALTPVNTFESINIGHVATSSALVHLGGKPDENSFFMNPLALRFNTAITDPLTTALQVNGNILPTADDTYLLGNSSLNWQTVWTTQVAWGSSLIDLTTQTIQGTNWVVEADLGVGTTNPANIEFYVLGDAQVSNTMSVIGTSTVGAGAGLITLDPSTGTNNGTITIGSAGDGKLNVGTVDPPYTINGEKYATYLSGMIGVKEEVTGNITTNEYLAGIGYRKTINFNNQEKGSDLWLFGKTTNIKNNLSRLSVLLTPKGQAKTWYEINEASNTIYVYASTPTEISYRLTAPRFDDASWTNTRASGPSGFVLNDPDSGVQNVQNENTNYSYQMANIDGVYNLFINNQEIKETSSFANSLIANLEAGIATVKNLVADNIITNKLVSPVAFIDSLTVRDATISGTLTADNIKGKTIDRLNEQLNILNEKYSTASAILASLQEKVSEYGTDPLQLSPLATTSATLPEDISEMNQSIIASDILANGAIFTKSLSSFDTDLFIQPSGDRSVHLLANLMTLYPNGQVVIEGDLIVTGNIFANNIDTRTATVSGSLAVGRGSLATDSANLLAVFNNDGNIVSSIDASGSANFGKLITNGLVIASGNSSDATMSGQAATNSTIGTATIATNSAEITIVNNKVNSNTLIYITPISNTSNQVMYVKSKNSCDQNIDGCLPSFTVAVPQPVPTETSFNYWLIQTR